MHDMLYEIGVNWNNLESEWKNGLYLDLKNDCIHDNVIFSLNRAKVEKLMEPIEG